MNKIKDPSKEMLQAENEELRRFATILEIADDAIISINADQHILFFNQGAEKIFGYTAEEAQGQSLNLLLPPRFTQPHHQYIQDFVQSSEVARTMGNRLEVSGLRKNGEEFPAEASISKVKINETYVFTVMLRDISERKKLELELKKAREQAAEKVREQAELLDFAPNAIFILDLEDKIIFWNKGAERTYGWTEAEVLGKKTLDLLFKQPTSQLSEIRQSMFEKGEWVGELSQITKTGKEIIAESHRGLVRDSNHQPKAQLIVNTDVTEKKRWEAQFFRSQRMESIGTLAGGIAHDLNNVLTPIIMGIQFLSNKLPDEESRRIAQALIDQAQRGAEMVKQVLSFARGVDGERMPILTRDLITDIRKIIMQTFPKSIEIKTNTPTDTWPIRGDATQLHQVLMNLCVNARDAMPEGGELQIQVSNTIIDEQYARMQVGATSGPFVVITVTDIGTGMTQEVMSRIFEPFFTTKEVGKGTGLGLATAMGIVKSHNGFISVYSELGTGTSFKVHLPAILLDEMNQAEGHKLNSFDGHGELILVVDDEALIRQITKATLESHGYRVLTANDGAEGIVVYANQKEAIDLVIIDIMMPNLDGHTATKIMLQLNPQVRIISISGFAPHGKALENSGVKLFLPKPYTAEKLLEVIAGVLQKK